MQPVQRPISEIMADVTGRAHSAKATWEAAGRPQSGPVAAELLEVGTEALELYTRQRAWDAPPRAILPARDCGHAEDLDRTCLQCGRTSCPECQSASGPQTCRYCLGTVWLDNVPKPPELKNPDMGDC